MPSKRRHDGYLLVDHRNSPGITPELAREAGRDPAHCGEGQTFESATNTCAHCQNIVVLNPGRVRARPYCQPCDHYICDGCEVKRHLPGYQHLPFAQMSDVMLDRAEKGMTLGSPQNLLVAPKIVVPSTFIKETSDV